MAINKTARNLLITIKTNYIASSKTFADTAEKVEIVATGQNLALVSNKKVCITSK
jgi:hypothetical protein